jgi:hypothetical protein
VVDDSATRVAIAAEPHVAERREQRAAARARQHHLGVEPAGKVALDPGEVGGRLLGAGGRGMTDHPDAVRTA